MMTHGQSASSVFPNQVADVGTSDIASATFPSNSDGRTQDDQSDESIRHQGHGTQLYGTYHLRIPPTALRLVVLPAVHHPT